jgi:hypothetical protein
MGRKCFSSPRLWRFLSPARREKAETRLRLNSVVLWTVVTGLPAAKWKLCPGARISRSKWDRAARRARDLWSACHCQKGRAQWSWTGPWPAARGSSPTDRDCGPILRGRGVQTRCFRWGPCTWRNLRAIPPARTWTCCESRQTSGWLSKEERGWNRPCPVCWRYLFKRGWSRKLCGVGGGLSGSRLRRQPHLWAGPGRGRLVLGHKPVRTGERPRGPVLGGQGWDDELLCPGGGRAFVLLGFGWVSPAL